MARIPTMPTEDEIGTAILWLRNNEGDEAPRCKAVADWLEAYTEDHLLKTTARAHGIPVARLRRKLEEKRRLGS